MQSLIGVPGGARTPDPRLRRAMLYPTELLAHVLAGVAGFEPTNARVKVSCLTAGRHPKVECACSNPARACLRATKPIFATITLQTKRAQATLVAQLVCFMLIANIVFSLSVYLKQSFCLHSFVSSKSNFYVRSPLAKNRREGCAPDLLC